MICWLCVLIFDLTLPALKDRKEDIEPNLAYELQEYARLHGNNVTFNIEARDRSAFSDFPFGHVGGVISAISMRP